MKKLIGGLIFLAFLLPAVSAAGQTDSVSVPAGKVMKMDDSFLEPLQKRDSVLVADQFRYGFHLKKVPEGMQFELPDFSKGFMDSVEIVSPWRADTVKVYGKKNSPKTYDIDISMVITSFDKGKYVLRPLSLLKPSKKGGVDTLVFKTQTMDVRTMPVDTTTYKIHDIKGQIKYPFKLSELIPYVAAIWALAILGILLWALLTRKKKSREEAARKDPPHLVALRKLDRLRGNKYWAPDKQKFYYSGITDALREYISARFGIDAMEMTTAEIFKEIKREDIPADMFAEMKTLFETADFVKFAKAFASDEENAAALPAAVRFVTTTYQSQLAQEDASAKEAEEKQKKGGEA